MRLTYLFFVILSLISFTSKTYADSPLTSIDLWLTHSEDHNIQHAFRTKKMDQKSIDFLLDERNSMEIRICVANAIGWKFRSNQKSSKKLLLSILKKYNIKNLDQLHQAEHGSILSIYSYFLALDNYFNVGLALEISQKAVAMNQEEPLIKYISLLILSQHNMMSKNNCGVYTVFKDLDKLSYFKSGSGSEILKLTLSYVKSYSSYCK